MPVYICQHIFSKIFIFFVFLSIADKFCEFSIKYVIFADFSVDKRRKPSAQDRFKNLFRPGGFIIGLQLRHHEDIVDRADRDLEVIVRHADDDILL